MNDPKRRPLSSAAQAVLDAFWKQPGDRSAIAAACRAVADQVVPELGRSPDDSREDERLCVRDEILAIAAELGGHHG